MVSPKLRGPERQSRHGKDDVGGAARRRSPREDLEQALARSLLGTDVIPSPELDRYLDATSRCIARYGLRRVSVQDVARELGVDRTTVYRQVGPIKAQLRLLAARDIGRTLSLVPLGEDGPVTAERIVETMATIVELSRSHPVLRRIVEDEGDLLSLTDLQQLQEVLAAAGKILAPLLEAAMRSGWLARRDPLVVSSWLVGTVAWLVLMPPPADVRALLQEIVPPVLNP